MSFLSAVKGFAEGLDKTLSENRAYQQQALLDQQKSKTDLFNRLQIAREEYRLRKLENQQEQLITVPGFPFKLFDPKHFENTPRLYGRNIVNQIDARISMLPEEMQQLALNNRDFTNYLNSYVAQAMEPEIIKGLDGGIHHTRIWGAGSVRNPFLQQHFQKLGYEIAPRARVDPTNNQLTIALNEGTLDKRNSEYNRMVELVDQTYGKGSFAALEQQYRDSSMFELQLPLPITVRKDSDGSMHNNTNKTFTRAFQNLSPIDVQLINNDPEVFKFFDSRNPLAHVFANYMKTSSNSSQKRELAEIMFSLMPEDDITTAGQSNDNRNFEFFENALTSLATSIAMVEGAKQVTYQGENRIEHAQKPQPLSKTHRTSLIDSYEQTVALHEQFDDVQDSLFRIAEVGLPGSNIPLSLSKSFTTIFGSTGAPEGEGIEGIITGVGNVLAGLITDRTNIMEDNRSRGTNKRESESLYHFDNRTIDELQAEKNVLIRTSQHKDLIHETTNENTLLEYEKVRSDKNKAAAYFATLSDKNKAKIQQFYLEAAKVELTYKLAMIWQGGAGGRMVSDQDFRIIRHAIWGLPSAQAQAAALEFIRMSSIRPMLRTKMLLELDNKTPNPFNTLQLIEPALQAGYTKARNEFLNNYDQDALKDSYDRRIAGNYDHEYKPGEGLGIKTNPLLGNSPPIS